MPTAAQKHDKIQRHEKLKARYVAKASSQVAAFDVEANAARKRQLSAFWRQHETQLERWWHAHPDRTVPCDAAIDATAPTTEGFLASRIARMHKALLPELTFGWLDAADTDEATRGEWPPPPRGLLWLMRTRAAAAPTNADDAADLAAVKLMLAETEEDDELRVFPGLTDAQLADSFCGLGNGFALATPLGTRELARGETVEAVGAPKVEILMGDLRGQVARLSPFRQAMYRQDAIYLMLLALAQQFLDEQPAASAAAAARADARAGGELSPLSADDADAVLRAAAATADLALLRAAIERCGPAASSGALEAARAERDRLAKKAKKAKARDKKAAGAAGAAGTDAAEATAAASAQANAVHEFMKERERKETGATEDSSDDEETAAALAAAAEARAQRRREEQAAGGGSG